MKAELLETFGGDLMVVNAARVSFDKKADWLEGYNFFHTQVGWMEWLPEERKAILVDGNRVKQVLHQRDEKLIRYLAKHGHWSPFSHPRAQFRITAPFFVARQWEKHRIGAVRGYDVYDQNEVSRRYVDDPPQFLDSIEWRSAPDGSIKQGSGDVLCVSDQRDATLFYNTAVAACEDSYKRLLRLGVAPEQARMVLPVSAYTTWIETGSLLYWSRVVQLRTDAHAQKEIQDLAKHVCSHMANAFPISWSELTAEDG